MPAAPSTTEDDEAESPEAVEDEEFEAEAGEARAEGEEAEAASEPREGEPRRRRRRRGRGRGRGGEGRDAREGAPQQFAQDTVAEHEIAHEDHDAGSPDDDAGEGTEPREGVMAGNGHGEERDGRRRRRRGRRGGRRNRHRKGVGYQGNGHEAGEEHETAFEGGVHETSGGAPHPVVSDEDAMVMAPSFPQPAAVHADAAPAAAAPGAPAVGPLPEQAPRRRSTVREPAPVASVSEAAPPSPPPQAAPASVAEPVVSSTSNEPATPKRGWWGRRLLGDK
jgi:ribonuclease E